MVVSVTYMGPVKRSVSAHQHDQELGEQATVGELLTLLGYREGEQKFLTISVNGTKATGLAPLHQGDAIVISLLVGGG